jgi:hypothetical protein
MALATVVHPSEPRAAGNFTIPTATAYSSIISAIDAIKGVGGTIYVFGGVDANKDPLVFNDPVLAPKLFTESVEIILIDAIWDMGTISGNSAFNPSVGKTLTISGSGRMKSSGGGDLLGYLGFASDGNFVVRGSAHSGIFIDIQSSNTVSVKSTGSIQMDYCAVRNPGSFFLEAASASSTIKCRNCDFRIIAPAAGNVFVSGATLSSYFADCNFTREGGVDMTNLFSDGTNIETQNINKFGITNNNALTEDTDVGDASTSTIDPVYVDPTNGKWAYTATALKEKSGRELRDTGGVGRVVATSVGVGNAPTGSKLVAPHESIQMHIISGNELDGAGSNITIGNPTNTSFQTSDLSLLYDQSLQDADCLITEDGSSLPGGSEIKFISYTADESINLGASTNRVIDKSSANAKREYDLNASTDLEMGQQQSVSTTSPSLKITFNNDGL